MKDKDKKTLTEYLGECFHEIEDKGAYQSICSKCGMVFGAVHSSDWNPKAFNRTFDNWKDFGALIERVEEKDQWNDLFLFGYLPYHKTQGPLVILEAINAGVVK